jgi:hypothetical protein
MNTLSPKSDALGTELQNQRHTLNNLPVPPLMPIVIVAAAAFAVAAIGRYYLMENDRFALECAADGSSLWCLPWKWLPQVFLFNRLGLACLAAAATAFVFRLRSLAWIGLFLGACGLVLYCFDYSAVGGLLSLLTLAANRTRPFSHQQA